MNFQPKKLACFDKTISNSIIQWHKSLWNKHLACFYDFFLQNYYPSRHQRGTQKYNISHWNFFSIRNCHISITFTYYIAKQHLKYYMDSKSLVNGSFIHLMKGDGLLQLKIIIIFLDIVMQMCDFAVIT